MLREDLHNISIDNLLENGQISVRASNCCFNAKLKSLADIIGYYEDGKSFSEIRNAGRRTCIDLETLCKEYISRIANSTPLVKKTFDEKLQRTEAYISHLIETDFLNAVETGLIEATEILDYLSTNQKEILEDKFKQYTTLYSIRTANRIKSLGFDKFVTDYLFCSDNELYKIQGLGCKSIEKEVIELKNKVKEEFLHSINLREEDIARINLIKEKGDIMLNDFVANFYQSHNHLPMLWIIEQNLITEKSRNIDILTDTFPIFKNFKSTTLEDVATKYNITRERVRQIRNDTFHCTFEITNEVIEYKKNSNLIKFAELLQRKDDWKYLLEFLLEKEIINQNSSEIQECLKNEQCNLSFEFTLQLIGYLFRENFSLFGGFEITNKDRVWKNTFLIRKELTDIFDFEKFKEDFANHIAENETEYGLNVDEFLSNSACWTDVVYLDKFDDVANAIRNILLHEFCLCPNPDGLIAIPATKEKSPLKMVYEILKAKGEPMHLDDIFIEFKRIVPEHKYTEASQLRAWLQRHEEISFRNRNSVYTLREWEHIKSGTIRDAIVEFLSENDVPQTADDITDYVLQYFPKTNVASIRTTMFNDTQKRFSFFGDNLFGLVYKEYPAEYEEMEQQGGQRKSFEQRLYNLEKFLAENDHFPFATSDNEDESSLYRWWRIQNKKTEKLTTEQKESIERIKRQYADFESDRFTYEWFQNFNHFRLFILENSRLPSASESEKFLYGWFRRAKDDFLNDRLSEIQRTKYAELFKEIIYAER